MVALSTHTVKAEEFKYETAKLTCYCPPTFPQGKLTASGTGVRYGVIASTREHLGDAVEIWAYDENAEDHKGQYLGLFFCEDIGGTEAINKGYVIDMWLPSMEQVKEMTVRTGGKVVMHFIKRPKGLPNG